MAAKKPLPDRVKLKNLDSLFGIEEEQSGQIMEVPIEELFPFQNHPFKVLDDEKMAQTVESIRENGILVPIMVRNRAEGGYEVISGHRRRHAAEIVGLETVPVIIRDLTDDEAVIAMVDANLQREEILPSEKAFAYKMKLEAIKHKAGRPSKENSCQLGTNYRADEAMAENANDSARTIQRYIRLTELLPELLTMVDSKGIKTDKGNHNREVRYLNSLIVKVREIKKEHFDKFMDSVKETASDTVKTVKNEVLELIHRTAAKKKFMSLPVVKSKYIAKISNREVLSNPKLSEDFVKNYGIETFEQLKKYIEEHSKTADDMDTSIKGKWQRLQDLKELAEVYAEYSRLRDIAKESRNQSIFTKKKFDKEHEAELSDFDYYDARLSELKGDAKATPKAWAREIESLEKELPPLQTEYGREISRIATAEVIEYTKKDMERIEVNERRAAERQQSQRKKQHDLS